MFWQSGIYNKISMIVLEMIPIDRLIPCFIKSDLKK